jgi:ABC-type iron transport system FetAB ATPase subunit
VGPLDLELRAGECLVIAGPSGAGKTLLLRAIADLDVHDGEVRLDGASACEMKAHLWRQQVGLLPAESQWWAERVGDHFNACDEKLLARLGFSPEVMDWEISRCSTGERQRLSLLRLLQNKPSVLLLDEPTASLDAENVARVEELIGQLRHERDIAVLWVSHDPSQAERIASRRLRMVGGKLEERS